MPSKSSQAFTFGASRYLSFNIFTSFEVPDMRMKPRCSSDDLVDMRSVSS